MSKLRHSLGAFLSSFFPLPSVTYGNDDAPVTCPPLGHVSPPDDDALMTSPAPIDQSCAAAGFRYRNWRLKYSSAPPSWPEASPRARRHRKSKRIALGKTGRPTEIDCDLSYSCGGRSLLKWVWKTCRGIRGLEREGEEREKDRDKDRDKKERERIR